MYSLTAAARVLAAIASGIEGLKEYYSRPERERKTCNKGPYFRGCHSSTLECVKEMKQIPWLFEAKLNNEEVVVKFVNSHYGEDVHQCLV